MQAAAAASDRKLRRKIVLLMISAKALVLLWRGRSVLRSMVGTCLASSSRRSGGTRQWRSTIPAATIACSTPDSRRTNSRRSSASMRISLPPAARTTRGQIYRATVKTSTRRAARRLVGSSVASKIDLTGNVSATHLEPDPLLAGCTVAQQSRLAIELRARPRVGISDTGFDLFPRNHPEGMGRWFYLCTTTHPVRTASDSSQSKSRLVSQARVSFNIHQRKSASKLVAQETKKTRQAWAVDLRKRAVVSIFTPRKWQVEIDID